MRVCDLNRSIPISSFGPVDAISTCNCLEAVCIDVDSYTKAMKNMTTLLKPGGHLILIGVTKCSSYVVGKEIFHNLSMATADIFDAIAKVGLNVITCQENDVSQVHDVVADTLVTVHGKL